MFNEILQLIIMPKQYPREKCTKKLLSKIFAKKRPYRQKKTTKVTFQTHRLKS